MKKVVCYCDICKRETKDVDLVRFVDEYDICKPCRYDIINKVIKEKTFNLTPWCKVCNGTRKIKECVGHSYDRNEYETKQCIACKL